MTGYFRRKDLTDQAIRNGWFHTGDIGQVCQDGRIFLTGRQKYEINKGGMKVMPEDIDELLERHDLIDEACAFSVPDDIAGETVGVAITTRSGQRVDLNELKIWCRAHLAGEKVPDHWFQLDAIPKTDRGKINRSNVAAHCLAPK